MESLSLDAKLLPAGMEKGNILIFCTEAEPGTGNTVTFRFFLNYVKKSTKAKCYCTYKETFIKAADEKLAVIPEQHRIVAECGELYLHW